MELAAHKVCLGIAWLEADGLVQILQSLVELVQVHAGLATQPEALGDVGREPDRLAEIGLGASVVTLKGEDEPSPPKSALDVRIEMDRLGNVGFRLPLVRLLTPAVALQTSINGS